jgi:hypothetical protein
MCAVRGVIADAGKRDECESAGARLSRAQALPPCSALVGGGGGDAATRCALNVSDLDWLAAGDGASIAGLRLHCPAGDMLLVNALEVRMPQERATMVCTECED